MHAVYSTAYHTENKNLYTIQNIRFSFQYENMQKYQPALLGELGERAC